MPIDKDGNQIAAIMTPFYRRLLQLSHQDANVLIGLDTAFNFESVEVQRVLHMLATNVRRVADTTKEDIRRLVGQGADEGWSTPQLSREIRKLGEIASSKRATMIARTESTTGYSQGSLLRYQESGVVGGTEWLLAGDPCPICADLAGKTVPLGETYADGIDAPPAHPSCRCALSPVLS